MKNQNFMQIQVWKTVEDHYLLLMQIFPIRYNTADIIVPGFPAIEESHGFVLLDQRGNLLQRFEAHQEYSLEDYMYTINVNRVLGGQLLRIDFDHQWGREDSCLRTEIVIDNLQEVSSENMALGVYEKAIGLW